MIEQMSKITIATPKEDLDNLLKVIFKSKLIHLSQVNQDSKLNLTEIEEFNIKKEELQYLNTIYQDIDRFFLSYDKPIINDFVDLNKKISFDKAKSALDKILEEQTRWKQEIALLEQNESILSQYENLVDKFKHVIPNLGENSELNVRGILIANPTYEIQTMLKNTLKNETKNNFHLQLHQVSPKLAVGSITYPKLFDNEIKGLLNKLNITDVVLPSEVPGKTIGEKIQNFEQQKETHIKIKSKCMEKLNEINKKFLDLSEHKQFIYESFNKLEGLKYLRASEYFVILEGFVPTNKIRMLQTILETQLQKNYSIKIEKATTNVPIKITNRKGIREFEVFTGMVQPLAYNTIDPTFLMALIFPIFYGFIIGDIGYGLIIALAGFILYRKFYDAKSDLKSISNIGWVFLLSGIVSIFFGILFGEFFGNLGEEIGLHPVLYHRNDNILDLLLISIGIGIFHVMLGILLGIYNARKIHNHHKFFSNIGYFLTNLGLLLTIFSFIQPIFNQIQFFYSIITIIGIFCLLKTEGIISLIELISFVGNMLSYARLMALGIASVILADIANEFYFIAGGGFIGVVLVLLMHSLNIAIAMFSPLIHSMRLHLVEFFSKFNFDGNEIYKPFGS